MYTVIVTGWRHARLFDHGYVVQKALERVWMRNSNGVLLRHGACPIESPDGFRFGGVDGIADAIGLVYGWDVQPVPAETDLDGRLLGHERNGLMCEIGADKVLAFPGPRSKGTWSCIRWAEFYGIPVERHDLI